VKIWSMLLSLVLVAVFLNAQTSSKKDDEKLAPVSCELKHNDPNFLISWYGQPGSEPNFQDSAMIRKGSALACLALGQQSSSPSEPPIDPACVIGYLNGSSEVLVSHGSGSAARGGKITMSCRGKNPTCCKLQAVFTRP
jgi:hypothetical protein